MMSDFNCSRCRSQRNVRAATSTKNRRWQ